MPGAFDSNRGQFGLCEAHQAIAPLWNFCEVVGCISGPHPTGDYSFPSPWDFVARGEEKGAEWVCFAGRWFARNSPEGLSRIGIGPVNGSTGTVFYIYECSTFSDEL